MRHGERLLVWLICAILVGVDTTVPLGTKFLVTCNQSAQFDGCSGVSPPTQGISVTTNNTTTLSFGLLSFEASGAPNWCTTCSPASYLPQPAAGFAVNSGDWSLFYKSKSQNIPKPTASRVGLRLTEQGTVQFLFDESIINEEPWQQAHGHETRAVVQAHADTNLHLQLSTTTHPRSPRTTKRVLLQDDTEEDPEDDDCNGWGANWVIILLPALLIALCAFGLAFMHIHKLRQKLRQYRVQSLEHERMINGLHGTIETEKRTDRVHELELEKGNLENTLANLRQEVELSRQHIAHYKNHVQELQKRPPQVIEKPIEVDKVVEVPVEKVVEVPVPQIVKVPQVIEKTVEVKELVVDKAAQLQLQYANDDIEVLKKELAVAKSQLQSMSVMGTVVDGPTSRSVMRQPLDTSLETLDSGGGPFSYPDGELKKGFSEPTPPPAFAPHAELHDNYPSAPPEPSEGLKLAASDLYNNVAIEEDYVVAAYPPHYPPPHQTVHVHHPPPAPQTHSHSLHATAAPSHYHAATPFSSAFHRDAPSTGLPYRTPATTPRHKPMWDYEYADYADYDPTPSKYHF
eukprot:TRINITY_DN59105_c0_g1_i1.p1 TRINITY_DN59105_c0_g1~~TRINITY_DN59105_c0_g1_i1.p1  ORF type:complete len:572 (-),score=63.08 TRINITY_DN59105_c0_g1_i1:108-1823(-)